MKKITTIEEALAAIHSSEKELIEKGFIELSQTEKSDATLYKLCKEALHPGCVLIAKYGNQTDIITSAIQATSFPDNAKLFVWYPSIDEIKKRNAELSGNSCM